MNEDNQEPTPNQPPALPEQPPTDAYEPMSQRLTLGAVIDALLKSPRQLLYEWQEGRSATIARSLLFLIIGAFLIFGFLLGLFSGGTQLWAAPTKVLGGIVISGLITLPSLYVFSSLGGFDMSLKKASGLMISGIAIIGVLLLALAPVLWIFTQSTDSVGFMGFLVLIFWIAALFFGIGRIVKNARAFGEFSTGYLTIWAAIFIIVTMQMSTSLRPLIGPAEETFLPTEKRFFLQHWVESLSGDGSVYRD